MFQPKITEINRHFNRQFSFLWLVNWPTFNRLLFKNKEIAKILKIFSIFFSKINRISTEFFFKYKKISKIILKKFFEFVFLKIFCTIIFFYKFFFGKNFYYRIFFGENFSFHKNISAKIFFTIFLRIPFVFDICEIMYFAEFFIRNFAYCEFFCFALFVYIKKKLKKSKIFCDRTFGFLSSLLG